MPGIRNLSDREHEQEHRRNNGNGSTNTGNSSFAHLDHGVGENASRHRSEHNGIRQGAVDSSRDLHGSRPRRGAIDFGRGPHEGLFSSGNGDNEDSVSLNDTRRGSAADHDEFRGIVGARGSERRPVNSTHQVDLEHDRLVRGQDDRPASEEGSRRSQESRSRVERPRQTESVSHEAQNDGEDDFEPRGLRRAVPLTEARVEERAAYVYYRPHGPRREVEPRSARR